MMNSSRVCLYVSCWCCMCLSCVGACVDYRTHITTYTYTHLMAHAYTEATRALCVSRCVHTHGDVTTAIYDDVTGLCACRHVCEDDVVEDVDGTMSVQKIDLGRSLDYYSICILPYVDTVPRCNPTTVDLSTILEGDASSPVSQGDCVDNGGCYYDSQPNTCYYSNLHESGFFLMSGGCISTTDISTLSVTRHQCALVCLGDSECVSFTYRSNTSNPCVLHSSVCQERTVPGVDTYYKVASPGYRCRRNIRLDTAAIQSLPVASPWQCRQLCEADTNCVMYQMYHMTGHDQCALKDTTSGTQSSHLTGTMSCDKVYNGVITQSTLTGNAYTTSDLNRARGRLYDGDSTTCFTVTMTEEITRYVARMYWPIVNNPVHKYHTIVRGRSMPCSATQGTMVVYTTTHEPIISVTNSWGLYTDNFSADDRFIQCSYVDESVDSDGLQSCRYWCEPQEEVSVMTYVRINFENDDDVVEVELCEVVFIEN